MLCVKLLQYCNEPFSEYAYALYYRSEELCADCHDGYSSRSGSNPVHYMNTKSRYDDTEYSSQSYNYRNKEQINHGRSRIRRAINDESTGYGINTKGCFSSIASRDYYVLTFDENVLSGRYMAHSSIDSNSEFDHSYIKFVETQNSNEQYGSETENTSKSSTDFEDMDNKKNKT
jgi:hypothetical protein